MGNLIWEESLGAFLLVTVALAGGSAYMTGRAVALGWDALWKLVAYLLLLACAARFIHFALFGGTLLTLHYFVVDLVVLLGIGYLAYLATRAGQMASQYSFGFERAGPLGWRSKR
ncbi:MAG: hypothetical protein R3E44_15760 [Paracoccaceae bacterium]